MRCEVCGRKIHTNPIRANIEGAKLTVCAECAKHGKIIYPDEENTAPKSPFLTVASGSSLGSTTHPSSGTVKSKRQPQMVQKKRNLVAKVEITQELVEGYAALIRVTRENLGFTHETLGLKISERASVLKHVELGKMEPNNLLASKLEHVLRIKLLVPIEEEKSTTASVVGKGQEMTLGDIIEIESNPSEASKRRK
jgi:putative transcription factor